MNTTRGAGDRLRRGMKASVVSAAPNVLTLNVSWKARSVGVEVLSVLRQTPALLINTSRRPNFEVTC
jgi:hypothetical protein